MCEACHDRWLSVEESILKRAEKRMLRMMCVRQLAGGVSTKELITRLEVDNNIIEMMRQKNLRWLSHAVRKGDDDCVKQTWSYEFESNRQRARLRLAWKSMMENFCRGLGLGLEDA